LPWSREDQTKLWVVEKPKGTLVYTLPLPSTLTSGSKPGRCWSTTTAWEKPTAGVTALRACGEAAELETVYPPTARISAPRSAPVNVWVLRPDGLHPALSFLIARLTLGQKSGAYYSMPG